MEMSAKTTHEQTPLSAMVLDLPVELWLHILSFLPRAQHPKLLGVNRVCFLYAMDEIYREVRFVDDGRSTLKTFHQLQYPSISSRVRHVHIRPNFFPPMVKRTFLGRIKRRMFRLKRAEAPSLFFEPREDLLFVAQCTFTKCSGTEELTIALHDLVPPPSFQSFLETIWTSFGPNLRRLTVDATPAKFPVILKDSLLGALPNLTDLRINLALSMFPSKDKKQHTSAVRAILCFVNALSETLESLTLSTYALTDIAPLFSTLRCFPRLQKLAIHVAVGQSDSVLLYPLAQFVARHTATLQHFDLLEGTITVVV